LSLGTPAASITIQCVLNGPLIIRGPFVLKDEKGAVIESGKQTALCRCSKSKHYPLCDGSHAQ
jgi:CDGSH-type Zn-finger protein